MILSILAFVKIILTVMLAIASSYLLYTSLKELFGDELRQIVNRRKRLPVNIAALQERNEAIMACINKHNTKQRNALLMYQIRRLNREMERQGVTNKSIVVK